MAEKKQAGLIILLIIVLLLAVYFLGGDRMAEENTDNIKIENNTVELGSLTLKQKLGQMVMIRGDNAGNLDLLNFGVGGVFLDKQDSEKDYSELIAKFQGNSKIKLIVATDLEGGWNPFSWEEFPKFQDIQDGDEAGKIGEEHGRLLKSLGFNMNFAPVSEYDDEAYSGRAFSGNKEEIKQKLKKYIKGLQESVKGVCKHYPGKGMINNLHLRKDNQTISKQDLELFEFCIENEINGVMIGHQIVEGEVNSEEKPASVSKEVIETLPDGVLVISDEVNMLGLKLFYFFNKRKMYRDLINSGENLILDFKLNKKSMNKLFIGLEKDVKNGKISEEKVDESVSKILKLKGYEVR